MDDQRREEALEQSGAGDYGGAEAGGHPATGQDSATGEGSPTGETAEAPPGGPEHQPAGGRFSEGERDLPGESDTLGGDGSEGSPH